MSIRCELKMASVNRKVICAIFDSLLIHTSESLRSSLVIVPDPENIGLAVGILLLLCKQADICVMSYLFPVTGRHL